MIERIALRIFIFCMMLCAGTSLVALWFGPAEDPQWFRLIPTFFILGFASFLIWGVQMVYRMLQVIESR